MPSLFDPLPLRGVTLRNRIGVSPMCQYSSVDGHATDWHLVHLGSRAVGGAGLVVVEATAVEPRGRISLQDLGIWDDAHVPMLRRIASFLRDHGAVAGIQLAHAGRKASRRRPWEPPAGVSEAEGGWSIVGPSAVPFEGGWAVPEPLDLDGIACVLRAVETAAARAADAGFDFLELHAAHGYLCHSFYSPLSNARDDEYGGSFENRIRFTVEAARAIRRAWPDRMPLSARLSCTDWTDEGWTPDDTVALARRLAGEGVDLVDCSSGGNDPRPRIPLGPGYQVPFAERVRRDAGIPTAAVGLITEPTHADEIIRTGRADMVMLARAELRDPYWPIHAAAALRRPVHVPAQYLRAFPQAETAPSLTQ
jgi:2,4-dienoyl-CoA reductase-like NADH-dependent reductase (Old Yellow Enzyme family)